MNPRSAPDRERQAEVRNRVLQTIEGEKMGRRDDMLAAIVRASGPVCDDCIAVLAGLTSRQQANRVGRELGSRGGIGRGIGSCVKCGKVKTVSARVGDSLPPPPTVAGGDGCHAWHWEGNVQQAIVAFLGSQGFEIRRVANTSTKETGVDVVAVDPGGHEWWITVKGFPEHKSGKTTNPSTQGRHWFSHAMFDVVSYRSLRRDVRIGVTLPDGFKTYSGLSRKASWLYESAPFTYFWVCEDGAVRVETSYEDWGRGAVNSA